MPTSHPASIRPLAHANPIPLPPPVTRAVLPEISNYYPKIVSKMQKIARSTM